MPHAWLSALTRLAALLVAGVLIGAYFDNVLGGLLLAVLVSLSMHLFQLFRLEQELRTRKPVTVPDGTGIWAQVLARINFLTGRIARHKRRYRHLLKEIRYSTNALPDGVVSLNTNYEITRYNAAARRLIGLRKRRDRGQRIDNLLRHPEFVAYMQSGDFQAAVEIPSPLEEGHWLRVMVVPYGPGTRLLLLRDITAQTRLARMRRDFVANASHELRSPLTVISGYLDALAEDPAKPSEWQRPLNEMRQQADRMRDIITELLELSRLEAGTRANMERRVNVAGLIRLVQGDIVAQPDTPSIVLDIESSRELLGNSAEVQSIVSNLVQNAVRHTEAGGTVTIGWQDMAEGGAELYVQDTGEGIAETDIPRLTERFFRVNRGRSRDSGGVGLGLAIVKHALNRHEGALHISSTPGSGSRFSCRFPESRLAAAAQAASGGDTVL